MLAGMWSSAKPKLPGPGEALPGRAEKMPVPEKHFVSGARLQPPFPSGTELATFGLGCFWGAEKKFWQQPGVYSTAVGYAGGPTPNPTYREVCSGLTGHTEVVQVVFDPKLVSYGELLRIVLGGARSDAGDAAGQRRRHAVPLGDLHARRRAARGGDASRDAYARALADAGFTARSRPRSPPAPEFFYAEDYHQQYLAKNPDGYCGLGGTGVSCPVGVGVGVGARR